MRICDIATLHKFQFTPLREGRPAPAPDNSQAQFISIHAPPRGATDVEYVNYWQIIFQFTPLREGRRSVALVPINCNLFQFTPLREGRRVIRSGSATVTAAFQFTPLREGRHLDCNHHGRGDGFQFTPLREGRQQKICNFCKSFVQPLQISMA